MNYNPRKKVIQINIKEADEAYHALVYALKCCREAGGLPLGPYDRRGKMEPIDHAQSGIFDAGRAIGLDMGAEWFDQVDLRDGQAEQVEPGERVPALDNDALACEVVDAILRDVTDRRGWRQEWERFDEDVKEEIKETQVRVVRDVLATHGGRKP